jgi:hypothetical protein
MELIAVLRILGRHRILVALGVALAILIAAAMLARAHTARVAEASQSLLMSTPDATVLDTTSKIAATLPDRATLLADLMMSEGARDRVARRARVSPSQLAIRGPAVGITQVATALPVAAEAASAPEAPYAVEVSTQDPTVGSGVPLITVTVTGADSTTAEDIASATVAVMREIAQGGTRASGILAYALGPPSVQTLAAGSKHKTVLSLVAGVGFLCLWCTGIVVAGGIRRRVRQPVSGGPVLARESDGQTSFPA